MSHTSNPNRTRAPPRGDRRPSNKEKEKEPQFNTNHTDPELTAVNKEKEK